MIATFLDMAMRSVEMPTSGQPLVIQGPGLVLRHWPAWLQAHGIDTAALCRQLRDELPWQQPRVRVYGRLHPVPRLTCWLGDSGCRYRYSGLLHEPLPWSEALEALRDLLAQRLGCRFNSLLLNRYRHGEDRMGWHADDEPELDPADPIASLSLGASRCLRFRPAPGRRGATASLAADQPTRNLELADGDLLVMDPPTQRHWQHGLPQRKRVRSERINLTFRRILLPS
jgi:alkylated DNA repair dioxygenase AlkB